MINTVAVKKRMLEMGLSNNDLAKKIGSHPSHVSNVVNGHNTLTLGMANKLQHALEISDDDFMHYFMWRG